jgi:hypothetical protein
LQLRILGWAGNVTCLGEVRNEYKILVGKHEEKMPLRRPRYRGEDNIRMVLREMSWESVDGMHLVQNGGQWQTLVNMLRIFGFHKKQRSS